MTKNDDIESTMRHDSFGLVSASRVSTTPMRLFGSPLLHQDIISLKIAGGYVRRGLNQEWFYEDKQIVEVFLSETQFASMICNINGNHTPCTLRYYSVGKLHRPGLPPQHMGDASTFVKEYDAKTAQGMKAAKDGIAKINEMMAGNSLRKGDLQEVKSLLETCIREINANQKFIAAQFEEHVTETVEKAKAEFDQHVTNRAIKIGLDAMGSELTPAVRKALEGAVARGDFKVVSPVLIDDATKPPGK